MKFLSLVFFIFLLLGCQSIRDKVYSNNTTETKKPSSVLNFELSNQNTNWGQLIGLQFIEKDLIGNMYFWTISHTPFQVSFIKIKADITDKNLQVVESKPLKDLNGEFFNGQQIDPESFALDQNHHFWLADRVSADFLEFDQQGSLIKTISFKSKSVGQVAIGFTQDSLYFVKQSKGANIGSYNLKLGRFLNQRMYFLENKKNDQVIHFAVLNDHQLLLLEKRQNPNEPTQYRFFQTELKSKQISKRLVLNLNKETSQNFEKIESFALIDSQNMAILNKKLLTIIKVSPLK